MPAVDDDVTPGEIVRTLRGLQDEIRALRGEHVRRDLYEAHRASVAADLARLDKTVEQIEKDVTARFDRQEQEKKSKSLVVYSALVVAGIGLLIQFIGFLK